MTPVTVTAENEDTGITGINSITVKPTDRVDPVAIAAADGSLAAELDGVLSQLQNRTKSIELPPDDVWGARPVRPVLVVKSVELKNPNISPVKLLEIATVRLEWYRPSTGERTVIEDGWAGLAAALGVQVAGKSIGDLMRIVCGSDEVVSVVADTVVWFIAGKRSTIEQALGE